MEAATHVLFDFFGTLVDYSDSPVAQDHRGSFRVLAEAGSDLDYTDFLALWSEVTDAFEQRAAATHREFSMLEVGAAFLERALGKRPAARTLDAFISTYMAEWNRGVHYLDGLGEMLERLAARFTLAVITNTHDPMLVPGHLARMEVGRHFEVVVTSVELGIRKPAAEIFAHAVGHLGADAARCIYVGDSLEADYHGARGAGLHPLLIDPSGAEAVPAAARLGSIFELERRLG